MLQWLETLDPEEALRLVNGNGRSYHALRQFSPGQAQRLAEAMPEGPIRDSMLGHLLPRLDPAEALPLLDDIESPQLRDKAVAELARQALERQQGSP